jgi:hypothetical protein
MKNMLFIIVTLVTIFLLTGCSSFPVINSGRVEVQKEDVRVKVVFSNKDRQMIYEYYKRKSHYKKKKGMPPGLAKKGKLPPGLQKKLEKHGTLPPGLAKRILPPGLEKQLSPLPEGYVRLRVSGDVILLHEPTQVIVDILHSVG